MRIPVSTNPRQEIARLAVAVMAADGRVTVEELDAVARLEALGLGPVAEAVRAALEEAARASIDLAATCAALRAFGPEVVGAALEGLTAIAMSDQRLTDGEARVLETIGRLLEAPGLERAAPGPPAGGTSAEGDQPPDPRVEQACRTLGVVSGATPEVIEAAFAAQLERYDPARVRELGPEFAILAIRRLAAVADAYLTLTVPAARATGR